MTTYGTLSAVNLIASAGITGSIGGVPISANTAAVANISIYDNISAVVQFANVKATANTVLSNTTKPLLNNLASNVFPSLTNAVPEAYIGSLGNTTISGLTGVVSDEIDYIMGSGDLGIFDQIFSSADAYVITTNLVLNSVINANNDASRSTFSTVDNTITGGISQITQAYSDFGDDLIALGNTINLEQLSNLGSPQALLQQIYSTTSGSAALNTSLINSGISQEVLINLDQTPMTDEQQKIAFTAMTTITGSELAQILKLLNVTTTGLTSLADLLNPVMMFPKSFNTLTAPTINGLRGIYINSTGAVNSNLETELPSNVLAPLQGYGTVRNTYAQLKKIIPPDWALANKALQAGLEQVKSIFNSTLPELGAATKKLESNKGLNLINALSEPLPASVTNYYENTFAIGTGTNGTLLLADIIGSAGGWNITTNISNAATILNSLQSNGSLVTLTDSSTGVYTVMLNALTGVYGIPDGTLANAMIIPGGLPAAGTYLTYDLAFTGPGSPGEGLLPAAYSLIGNIIANNTSAVSNSNSSWASIASQIALEESLQAQASITSANLIAGTSASSLALNLNQYGTQTSIGGAAWFLGSVANTSTIGGQAILSSMREARNQVLLQNAGIQTDIAVSDEGVEPQISSSPGQYTAAEAASQKII